MTAHRKNERGVALVAVAIFLGLLLAITAIGIDVGRLAHVANEVQTVADASARAGAKALSDNAGQPGFGIARAHVIGHDNQMNGTDAPVSDVLVDEGNYDFDSDTFNCCTNNTRCCSSGSVGGLTCGHSGSCTRRLAALAMPRTEVNNLLAGIFDFFQDGVLTANASGSNNDQTLVEKVAVATTSGPAAGCQAPQGCTTGDWNCYCRHGVAPCLPIAVPSCEFPPGCTGSGCQLPNLQVSSNGSDTAGWTGFDVGHSDSIVRSFLAQGPCDPPGQDRNPPTQSVDGTLSLNNGINSAAQNNVFGLTQCLFNNNQGCALDANGAIRTDGTRGRTFTIPVFDSESPSCTGNFNQSHQISGFATIQITGVSLGNPRTVSITTVRNTSATNQQPGGGCFGTDCRITMVR